MLQNLVYSYENGIVETQAMEHVHLTETHGV